MIWTFRNNRYERRFNKNKEDFLIERNFHKVKDDAVEIAFAKCKKEIAEKYEYWAENLSIDKHSGKINYLIFDNQHYIRIKNQLKEVGKDGGIIEEGVHAFFIMDKKLVYGFRVDTDEQKQGFNIYEIIVMKME